MDQIRIGRFIAQCRKAMGLTQRQLADGLGISDKTVSKWECGNGLPEVSLMLPLCAALGITVNDLLSGERVAQADYQKKAEENMMELIRENAENKKRLALSLICAAITGIAVCALIALAAFLTLPAAARIALIALALVTGAAGEGPRPCWTREPATISARIARRRLRPPWANMSRHTTPLPGAGWYAPPAAGRACAGGASPGRRKQRSAGNALAPRRLFSCPPAEDRTVRASKFFPKIRRIGRLRGRSTRCPLWCRHRAC